MQQSMPIQVQPSLKKMDILLHNAIQSSRSSYINRSIFHTVKLILLIIFLIIDTTVLNTQQNTIIVFLAIAIAVLVCNLIITVLFILLAYGQNQENNVMFLGFAAMLGHAVLNEGVGAHNLKSRDQCTSTTIYNTSTNALNSDPGLTLEIRKNYQNIYQRIISDLVLEHSPCLSFLEKNGKFGSFAILIFGIVALATSQPSSAEIGVIVVYLILQALNILVLLLIFLLIALSPLIIMFFCCFICCCNKQQSEAVNLPQPIQATISVIEKTDGSCPICFQALMPKEQVIVLRCSDKHVFHSGCLGNWMRVSSTCPLCRKSVNEGA